MPFVASSQSNKTGWERYHVFGNIREIKSTLYPAIVKNGSIEPDLSKAIHSEDHSFDTAGFVTEHYAETNGRLYISVYRANSDDILYTLHPANSYTGDLDTFYYRNGLADSMITKDRDGTVHRTAKLKTDANGAITEWIRRDARGSLQEIQNREYKNGVCIYESVKDGAGNTVRKMQTQLDDAGRAKIFRIFNDKEELYYARLEYIEFDEFNNWTKSIEYNKEGKAVRVTKRWFLYYGQKK